MVPTFVCDDILSAVHQVGAKAIPVDIDITTFNINPEDAVSRITKKQKLLFLFTCLDYQMKWKNFKIFLYQS